MKIAETESDSAEILGLTSRRVRLRNYREDDRDTLYAWHTDLEHLYLWTQDRDIPLYEKFISRFERRMKNRIDLFFVVEQISTGKPVGFVYNYGADSVDRITYLCIFIDPQYKARGFGIDVAVLFLNHLFSYFGYRKVYSEVYGFNKHVLGITEKAGFSQEGCLKEHRFWNGQFWDQHIYSISSELFNEKMRRYIPYLKKL